MSIEKELKELKELLENGDFEQDKEGIKEALKDHKEKITKERQTYNVKSTSQTFDKIIIGMIGAIIVAIGFTIYLYTQVDHQMKNPEYGYIDDNITQEETKTQESVKTETAKKTDEKKTTSQEELAKKLDQLASGKATFENLPKEIQEKYISQQVVDQQLEVLKKQYKQQIEQIQKQSQEAIKEIKTTRIKPQEKKALTFIDLPKKIRDQYVPKAQYDTKIKQLQDQLQKSLKQKTIVKTVSKPSKQSVVKSSETPTPYNYTNEARNSLGDAVQPIETIKCYDTDPNDIKMTATCHDKIDYALQQHKSLKYFEIVGVIGQSDKDKFKTTDEKTLEYLSIGLAQSRANESAWYIRKKVGNAPTIRPVNYPVYSKQDNKGVIIKIYK